MTEVAEKPISLDIIEIMNLIPHRYPFLLLTANEMFFNGHFPNNPIMPGVLQIEALAQTAAPILLTMEQYKGRLALFAGVDHVRFKNIVRPGDRFDMEVEMIKVKGPIAKCMGKGYVDGKLCVEAEITIALK